MFVQPLGAEIQADGATPAQRARMLWLADQLHAIGLAREQARARGDMATDKALAATAAKLNAERLALQKAIIAQTQRQQDMADAGAFDSPLERAAAAVRRYALIGGLLVGAAIILPPLLRRR